MLVLGRNLYLKLIKYDMQKEIQNENYTAIVPYCGYLIGCTAILAGAFVGPDSQSVFYKEYLYYVGYGILGICLMLFAGKIAERAILYKFNNTDEIVRDRNLGAAAVHCGIYLAAGFIISGCVTGDTLLTHGKGYGLISTLIYYILGMAFLIIFSKLHDKLTPYPLLEEIENDNSAVGISFGGHIAAIGIILMKASIGDIGTLSHGIATYLLDLSAIVLLFPCVRLFLDKIIVRNINIAKEVRSNNIAAGIGEAATIIAFAILIFFMVDFVGIV
jgi:uncharacterized membrane protein YjfL (UPF0719 family)